MDVNLEINLALKEFANGNKDKAYRKLKSIFKKNKTNDLLRFNLAVIEQELNLNDEAKFNYRFLIKNNQNLKAMVNLYLIYIKEDNFLPALDLINHIVKINDQLENVLKDKAFVLYKLKMHDESIKICKKYLLKRNDEIFLNILSLNYFAKNNIVEAKKILKKGLLKDKDNPILLNSLGRIYHESRDSKNAKKYLSKAYYIKRDSYEIINNLAGFYREEGDYDKAITLYNEALKINPNNPSLINNLAKVYFDIDNISLAKKYCLKALQLNKNDGNIKKILSLIYFKEHNFIDAWTFFDGRLNLSDFVEKNSSINKIRKKLLIKRNFNPISKILVLREQGIGDEILYGTMYKDLFNNYKNVTIECDKRLKNIFKNSFPDNADSFVNLGSISQYQHKLDEYDYAIYAGSLGRLFRNNINNFTDGDYLIANDKYIKEYKLKLSGYKKKYNIGISWRSFKNRYKDEKSFELNDLIKIFHNENCNFINLQYGDVNNEIKEFNKKFNKNIITLENLDLFNDFDNLAAVLKNLDLFISVSNSTAHLSAALGTKTLLIKPSNHAVFHYWNQTNEETPWYKSVTLLDKNIINKNNLIEKYLPG